MRLARPDVRSFPVLVFAAFVASSLYVHFSFLSWDFSAYILNARYLFGRGLYYEPFRPPLVPLLLAPEPWLGRFAEVLYIAGAALLFFVAAGRLADAAFRERRLRSGVPRPAVRRLFLVFALSGFAVRYAFVSGSELLWTGLMMLFLADLLRGRVSGHWFGLSVLARISGLAFAPFLLLARPRTILRNLALFAAALAPWLAFNFVRYGNAFAGIADSYQIVYTSRRALAQPLGWAPFLKVLSWFLPFAAAGLVAAGLVAARALRRRRPIASPRVAVPAVFALFALVAVRQFAALPVKNTRYIYPLALPAAFFATLGLAWILARARIPAEALRPALTAVLLATILVPAAEAVLEKGDDRPFYAAAAELKAMGLDRGRVLSHYWVPLHYLAVNAYPMLPADCREAVARGEIVVVFKRPYRTRVRDFAPEDLAGVPRLRETADFLILGRRAVPGPKPAVFDRPFGNRLNEALASLVPAGPARAAALAILNGLERRRPDHPLPTDAWRDGAASPE